MAYYLELGNQSEKRVLAIVTAEDGNTITSWTKLTGDVTAVEIRQDGDRNDPWSPLIKTSLEITVLRLDESNFIDILDSSDQDVKAFLTIGDRITDSYGLTATSKLLFKGNLTMQTWRETYNYYSPVKFTFHDRIGEIGERTFVPLKQYMSILEIFNNCLLDIVTADTFLVVDWAYYYEVGEVKYEYPENVIINVATFSGKTCEDVLTAVLEGFGMQLLTDFSYKFEGEANPRWGKLGQYGAIRARLVYNLANRTVRQALYEKDYVVVPGVNIIVGSFYKPSLLESVEISGVPASIKMTVRDTPPLSTGGDPFVIMELFALGVKFFIVNWAMAPDPMPPSSYTDLGIDEENDEVHLTSEFSASSIQRGLRIILEPYGYKVDSASGDLIIRATVESSTHNITFEGGEAAKYWYIDVSEFEATESTVINNKFNESRSEHLMGSEVTPLLNRNAGFTLDMKAKRVEGESSLIVSDTLIFPAPFSLTYLIVRDGVNRYLGTKIGQGLNGSEQTDEVIKMIEGAQRIEIPFGRVGSSKKRALKIDRRPANSPGGDTYTLYKYGEILMQSVRGGFNISFEGWTGNEDALFLYCMPVAEYKGNYYMYRFWGIFEGEFVNPDWFDLDAAFITSTFRVALTVGNYNTREIPAPDGETEIPVPPAVESGDSYKLHLFWYSGTGNIGTDNANYLTDVDVTQTSDTPMPETAKLVTNINPQNRQVKKYEHEIAILPNLAPSGSYYQNGVYDINLDALTFITRDQDGEAQDGSPITFSQSGTLLYHGNVQRAANYSSNRWLLDALLKIDYFRVNDIFTIDGRSCVYVNGSYDVKRGYLSGRFIEIVISGRQPAWQWEDSVDIRWEDNSLMLI